MLDYTRVKTPHRRFSAWLPLVNTALFRNVAFIGAAFAVAIVAGGYAWHILGRPAFGIDDADITMVYARNIAEGFGYVYRPLGERVEGSTSLLWTLTCAAWFATNPSTFAPLFVLAGALNCVTVLAALGLARKASPGFTGVVFAGLLLAASAAFHGWSAGTLMDLALWTALVTVAFVELMSRVTRLRFVSLACVLLALVLARPEGMLLAPACVCLHAAFWLLEGEAVNRVVRRSGVLFALVMSVVAAVTAFRLLYFGYAFPNTYYAKVGSDPVYTAVTGSRYVFGFVGNSPFSVLVTLALGYALFEFVALIHKRYRDSSSRPDVHALWRGTIAVGITVGFGLRLFEGADHFAGHRTLQPFVPLGAVLVASCASALLARLRRTVVQATPIVVALLVVLVPLEWWLFGVEAANSLRGEHGLARHHRIAGAMLAQVLRASPELPSLGVTAAGGIAFTYPGPIYDLLGLNWVRMAHASRDRVGTAGHAAFSDHVFWQTSVALVLPEWRAQKPNSACELYDEWHDRVLDGLLASARFRAEYRPAVVSTEQGYVQFFAHRSFAPSATLGVEFLPWSDDFPAECRATIPG